MPMLRFKDLSALRGIDQKRVAGILDRRAMLAGTRYEYVDVEGEPVKALPWDQSMTPGGARIPARRRKPMVQLGTEVAIVRQVRDFAVGEGRFPTLTLEGDAEGRVFEVLTGDDDLELGYHAGGQVTDLAVVGSAPIGFAHPKDDDDDFARWESLQLQSEWCEPVFAGERESERARQLAKELAKVEGSGVESDDEGPIFGMPTGVRSDDLVFLRYQWPVEQSVADTGGGVSQRDELVWHRRDYTKDAIVHYRPVRIRSGEELAAGFEPEPVDPHGWGVVPIVWARARGGDPGDREGPSIYTPALESTTAAADRSASFWTESSQVSGSPALKEIDVTDDLRDAALKRDDPRIATDVAVGPRAVLSYTSTGAGGGGSAEFLEISGEGPRTLKENTDGLIDIAFEMSGVVRPDPERIKGVPSGFALLIMFAPTVALAQGYRTELGRAWRLLAKKLAIAMKAEGEPGVDADKFAMKHVWPAIFKLTPADIQQLASALTIAVQGGVLSRETAIEMMASGLEVEDPEEEARRILQARGAAPFAQVPPPEPEQPEEEAEEEAEEEG